MHTPPLNLSDRARPTFRPVARGVWRLAVGIVNCYVVRDAGGKLTLVDTGVPGTARYVQAALHQQFGNKTPGGIVLTHAHFDHAGNAGHLAGTWDAPVYVHPLELPYVTGQSDYPPKDPTPGGAMCFFARFFPATGFDLRPQARPLPPEGHVPNMPEWRWIHTPGHTPGHVSLYRDDDGVLLAGDALATTDLDKWINQATWHRQLARPPVPFTPDWGTAARSVQRLARLEPRQIAAGHGLPMGGRHLAHDLAELAELIRTPPHGRYAHGPATYDETGRFRAAPPPPPDMMKPRLLVGAAVVALAAGAAMVLRRR